MATVRYIKKFQTTDESLVRECARSFISHTRISQILIDSGRKREAVTGTVTKIELVAPAGGGSDLFEITVQELCEVAG